MTTEKKTDINLRDFLRIGKNRNPIDILDLKIADYITMQQLQIMVLNDKPYLYKNGYYKPDEDGKILKAHIKALIVPELVNINRINRVYNLILSDYRIARKNEEVNQYPAYWINFKNGMYDPINREMLPHSPEYYAINQVPHEYHPDAKYYGSIVEKFLEGIFPDEQDREMFLAFAGYCMTTDTSLQKFMVIMGVPGSGKSTAINLLIDAVGERNTSCLTLQDLNERFMPTELLGKLLNACADLPKKALEQVDAIKRITGEDLIMGEYKGGKAFPFRSYAKLIFSANEVPLSLDEKSDAFYRRILLIDVKGKGEEIPELKKGLTASMPGFIRACMDALTKMYASNKAIDSPNSKELVHEYHRESDNVQAFLDDCIQSRKGEKIERTALYRMYENYCNENEWMPLGSRGFYRNLRGKGLRDYMSCGSRYFKDICSRNALSEQKGADFRQATLEENAIFSGYNL